MSGEKWRSWEVIGLFFVLVAGNLLHFVYDWSGENSVAAAFAATNESTWEHMKLLAVPWILWSLVEAMVLRREGGGLAARAAGLLLGLLVIPTAFYTYRGIWGVNLDWVNVLIFQAAVLLAFALSWLIRKRHWLQGRVWQMAGLAVLLIMWALFVWWTYSPPALPIFTDPLTNTQGI